MALFPSAGHLLSWAGLVPGWMSVRARVDRPAHASEPPKTTLIQISWPACRKKPSYFQAQFLPLTSRRGPKQAIVAVAASMLTAMYSMPRDGVEFRDLGDQYFAQRDKTRVTNRLLQRLRDLGVEVEVKAA